MKFFSAVVWRLAMLALPWQTRWFWDANLAGWPWEQGRLSFYISWFLILAVVLLNWRPMKNCRSAKSYGWAVFILIAGSLLASDLILQSARPMMQWWAQVLILILFGLGLCRAQVSRQQMAAWFVIALLPHAVLGFYQFAVQHVAASSWLGMASQLPASLGVSVIEAGGERILRAYGGFPHPNVFAGWLVMGAILSVWLASLARTKKRLAAWAVLSGALFGALFLTFSRSAWCAALVGAVGLLVYLKQDKIQLRFGLAALVISMLIALPLVISNRALVQTRFDLSRRLEAKSLEARTTSWKQGMALFGKHMIFGAGPNAELLTLAKDYPSPAAAPLEPPHNVYLLALADVGAVGMVALLYLIILFARSIWRSEQRSLAIVLIFPLLILAVFDHYLWSQWAGQTLTALTLIMVCARPNQEAGA
jgi:O-antigen ligase